MTWLGSHRYTVPRAPVHVGDAEDLGETPFLFSPECSVSADGFPWACCSCCASLKKVSKYTNI